MNRLLLSTMLLVLPSLPGCSSAPPPEDPPHVQMLKAVNDFASQLEELKKQIESSGGDAKKLTDALEAATKKLEEVKKTLEDNIEKASKQPAVERNVYNTQENRNQLEQVQERIRLIVVPLANLTSKLETDKDPKVKDAARKFNQTWIDLRTKATELDSKIMKSVEGK